MLSSSLLAFRNFTSKTTLYFIRPLASVSKNVQKDDLPKRPKKPLSSFFEYLQNNRHDIITNNPGISSCDVVRRCAEMYRNLSEADKKILKDKTSERLEVYKQQCKAFKDSLTPEQNIAIQEINRKKREKRAKRKRKELERKYSRPKHPMNAYAIFTRASKVERGNTPFVEFSKKLANMWKTMPADEKAIYLEEARLERERYAEEIIDWEYVMIDAGRPEFVRGYRKAKRALSQTKRKSKAKTRTKLKAKSRKRRSMKNKATQTSAENKATQTSTKSMGTQTSTKSKTTQTS